MVPAVTADLRNQITVDKSEKTVPMPCALCGVTIPHAKVFPVHVAKLTFRATIIGDAVWLPLSHQRAGFCVDPGPETERFWDDDAKREQYKRARREESERRWRS